MDQSYNGFKRWFSILRALFMFIRIKHTVPLKRPRANLWCLTVLKFISSGNLLPYDYSIITLTARYLCEDCGFKRASYKVGLTLTTIFPKYFFSLWIVRFSVPVRTNNNFSDESDVSWISNKSDYSKDCKDSLKFSMNWSDL